MRFDESPARRNASCLPPSTSSLLPDPAAGRGTPRAELYVVVDDPAGHHARALAAGAVELSPLAARDWGHRVAYSMDPDGHVLAVAAPL